MTPNLSKSYLLTVACIISTAQHANPNVKGHKEPFLVQFTKEIPGNIEYSLLIQIIIFSNKILFVSALIHHKLIFGEFYTLVLEGP